MTKKDLYKTRKMRKAFENEIVKKLSYSRQEARKQAKLVFKFYSSQGVPK